MPPPLTLSQVSLEWDVPSLGAEGLPVLEYAVMYTDSITHVASGSVDRTSFEVGRTSTSTQALTLTLTSGSVDRTSFEVITHASSFGYWVYTLTQSLPLTRWAG